MMWPQYVFICLSLFGVGIHFWRDGKARPYSFWNQLIAVCLEMWLLFMGGFFRGM